MLVSVLAVGSYFDLRFRRIPNWLTYPALLLSILKIDRFSIFVLLLGFVLAILFHSQIGAGDLKMAAVIAIYSHILGYSQYWIMYAFIAGGIFALISRKRTLPFAPFMASGALISIGFGNLINLA